jgi:peptide deformylase
MTPMDLKLVYYPDPRLRRISDPVAKADADLKAALPRMFEIMYRARGIGLAGPQVALNRRFVVANLTGDPEKKDAEQVFINPEIVNRSGEMREEEGCLSLPGMYAMIVRADTLTVRYTDLEGKTVEREVQGLEAKLFQHEIDHLDGILILDKMTPADRKQWAPLLKELEEDFENDVPPKPRARVKRSQPSR